MSDDQWDHAISTLLVAREQHGGRVRQLLQTILGVGHGGPADDLASALTELHCHLALTDDPRPVRLHGVVETRRPRHRPLQLHLFPDG